jgi:FlaA1/EpsC-like NDP-sugar epimerase
MLRERAKVVAQLLSAMDLGALVFAFASAYWVRQAVYGASRGELDLLLHTRALLIALPLFTLAFYFCGLYESFRLRSLLGELFQIGKACFWSTLILVLFVFLLQYKFVSRALLLAFAFLSFAFVGAERLAVRLIARMARSRGYNLRHIVVVGTGERAKELAESIRDHSFWGLRLLGNISENGEADGLAGIPLLGNVDRFAEAISGKVIDGIVFAIPNEKLAGVKPAFVLCREVGIPSYVYALPFDYFT